MRRIILLLFLAFISVLAFSQVNGYFNYAQDGHVYFYLENRTPYPHTATLLVKNVTKKQTRKEIVTIMSGYTFCFGPNYNWAWEKGETVTAIDPVGHSANWTCPYNDPDIQRMYGSNSGISSNNTIACYGCNGRGICQGCNGSGLQYAYGSTIVCAICRGTGRCLKCGGSGRQQNPYNNPVNITIPQTNVPQQNTTSSQTSTQNTPSNTTPSQSSSNLKYCTPVKKENKSGTIIYSTSGRGFFLFTGVHQKNSNTSGVSQEYSVAPTLYLMADKKEKNYIFALDITGGNRVMHEKYTENFIGNDGDKFLLECGNMMVYGQGTGTVPQKIVFELTEYHESKIPYMGGKEAKITNVRTGQSIYLGSWFPNNINTYSSRVKDCLSTMFDLLKSSSK